MVERTIRADWKTSGSFEAADAHLHAATEPTGSSQIAAKNHCWSAKRRSPGGAPGELRAASPPQSHGSSAGNQHLRATGEINGPRNEERHRGEGALHRHRH